MMARWFLLAACADADPDLFFPGKAGGYDPYGKARAYCNRCPVRMACLQAALAEESGLARHSHLRFAMRGGVTPAQRASMQWIWDEVA